MFPRRIPSLPAPFDRPSVRYFAASVCGFAVDLVVALTLREVFNLPVSVAAVISFVLIGACLYMVHEYWTFAGAASRATPGRMGRNFIAQLSALVTRYVVIRALEAVHIPTTILLAAVYLIIGAGCSWTVNFSLNRFWVFKGR